MNMGRKSPELYPRPVMGFLVLLVMLVLTQPVLAQDEERVVTTAKFLESILYILFLNFYILD